MRNGRELLSRGISSKITNPPIKYTTYSDRSRKTCRNPSRSGRPRPPDLSPLDYFLWSEIKRQLSELEHPPKTDAEMRPAICVAASLAEQEKVNKSIGGLIKRCEKCLEAGGKRFEHMLRFPPKRPTAKPLGWSFYSATVARIL